MAKHTLELDAINTTMHEKVLRQPLNGALGSRLPQPQASLPLGIIVQGIPCGGSAVPVLSYFANEGRVVASTIGLFVYRWRHTCTNNTCGDLYRSGAVGAN